MAYGAEVKNRSGKTIFGAKHLSIKKVMSGTTGVQYYTSTTTTTYNSNSKIELPNGASIANALVFARPVFNEANEAKELLRLKGSWPMAVWFQSSDTFSIIAPDDAVSYYNSERGDKTFEYTKSSAMYAAPPTGGQAACRVYYEVWIVGDGASSDETDSVGLEIKTDGGETIFHSNREYFSVESSTYSKPTAHVTFSQDSNTYIIDDERLGFTPLYMNNESEVSQSEYMCLLNGGAHACALFKGGTASGISGYEIPADPLTSYFRNFVEWHFEDPQNLEGRRPHIRQIPRLAYTKTSAPGASYASIRYNNSLGVKSLNILGKSS